MKLKLVALSFFAIINLCAFSQKNITTKDFKLLEGSWIGSLTYLDYTSNKPYTMPANIVIKQIKKSNQFTFANSFPDEKNANWTDTTTINSKANTINNAKVVSLQKSTNGTIEIITEKDGIDGNDNKKALLKLTYTFNQSEFTIRKDVQFDGEKVWINRHIYSYKKAKKQ